MLSRLSIQNYALISYQQIDFQKGFNVMTGETGAGKSIILGALALVMGARADAHSVAQGQQKCIVEAEFDIAEYDIGGFFDENDIDNDDSTHCILRREVTASGKSRAFINDSPVQLAVLKQLAERLIDIHSQHGNLLLRDNAFQLHFVDLMANNAAEREAYSHAFAQWTDFSKQLKQLKERVAKKANERDYMEFQHAQLEDAKLQDGELAELEEECKRLQHSEEIKISAQNICSLFDDDEAGVMIRLKAAEHEMKKLAHFVNAADELAQRAHSVIVELDDIRSEVESISENTDIDPARLEFVTQRIDTINSLMKKHGAATEGQLIELREQLERQLQEIDNADEEIERLEAQVAEARKTLENNAERLSATRKNAAPVIEQQLVEALAQLAIPHPKVAVQLSAAETFLQSGHDEVTLLFSANLNQQPRPVADIASGGEISRLMLCVKDMMARRKSLPTVIFDEIDTGISGNTADRVGCIMKRMADNMQVIAITHLPQIAAKAGKHLVVYKQDTDNATQTFIKTVADGERIEQLAVMLSGSPPTEAAKITAKELLTRDTHR